MKKRVMGIFKTEELAILAINRLETDGYGSDEISVIAKEREQVDRIEDATDIHNEPEHKNKAVTGAVTGGVIGGIGALLVEFGLLAIPGVGPILAAGPIALTLAGIAAGGISGALINYGFSETQAKKYESFLNKGNILVLVEVKNNIESVYANFSANESLITDEYFGGVIR